MTLTPRQKQLRGKTVKTLHCRQYKKALCRVQEARGGGENKKKNRIIEEKSKSEHNNPTREQEKERK